MTDLDLITKEARPWASLYANTERGKEWIALHLKRREADSVVTLPACLVEQYAKLIRRSSATVAVWERVE